MTLEGEDATYTAMSKTVGMPIFFATEMILNQKIEEKGILLPLKKEIYEPILKKLEEIGVIFHEKIISSGIGPYQPHCCSAGRQGDKIPT